MTQQEAPLPSDIDPVGKEILFRRHWSSAGWTKGTITPAEFDYAKRAGLMFDPIDVHHDATVERVLDLRGRIDPVLDRKTGVLRIKGIWWEPGVKPVSVQKPLRSLATFIGAGSIEA